MPDPVSRGTRVGTVAGEPVREALSIIYLCGSYAAILSNIVFYIVPVCIRDL